MALRSWSVAWRFFNYVQRARPSLNYFSANGRDERCYVQLSINAPCRMFSSDADAENRAMGVGPGLNAKSKKKQFVQRVTLLSEDNDLSVVTLEMAQKIAERRNLKLIKIVDMDTKTERPTYKLMSAKDYIQEGIQRKKIKQMDRETTLKAEKLLSISSKIMEHDLATKLKSVAKLLGRKHEVRILISLDGNKERAVQIADEIEKATKPLPTHVRQVSSGNNIKVYLRPILDAEKQKEKSEPKDDKAEVPVAPAS